MKKIILSLIALFILIMVIVFINNLSDSETSNTETLTTPSTSTNSDSLMLKSNFEVLHGLSTDYKKADIDLVFSSMAFHHISDIEQTLVHLHSIMTPNGKIVVGDIRTENGSFHHFEPIPHTGFDTNELSVLFEKAGFKVHTVKTYNILKRERSPGVITDYDQFILVAEKI